MDTPTLPIYLLSETSAKGVENLPLIKAKIKTQTIDLGQYEALVFTSKNAVNAIEKINPAWKEIPSYVIGEPTAKKVRELKGRVEYVAKNSYGDDFAHEIKASLKGKKVLFLRAGKVLSSLEEILKNEGVFLDSKVVYETQCEKPLHVKSLKKDAVVIFTSPSTVECFFKYFKWQRSNKAVCIGEKTAQALPEKISVFISQEQSIDGCIALAKTLIKQN